MKENKAKEEAGGIKDEKKIHSYNEWDLLYNAIEVFTNNRKRN